MRQAAQHVMTDLTKMTVEDLNRSLAEREVGRNVVSSYAGEEEAPTATA
jgi:hypothetical protein